MANWCLIYIPIVLKDAIPQELYNIWLNYVQACRLLCRRCIWKSSVIEADQALTYFCKGMEEYFGEGCCNINMHLHLHLNECAFDFGPLYSYWCCPFERYNGMIGSYSTNHKNIEKQLAAKFLREQGIRLRQLPDEFKHLRPDSFSKDTVIDVGSEVHTMSSAQFHFIETLQHSVSFSYKELNFALQSHDEKLMVQRNPTMTVLRADEQNGLHLMYTQLYGASISIKTLSAYALESKSVLYAGERINCRQLVAAKWPLDISCSSERIGEIRSILKHKITLDLSGEFESEVEHLVVEVWWYKGHTGNYFEPPCVIVQDVYHSPFND